MAHFVAGAALGRWASWYSPWSDENREIYRKSWQQQVDSGWWDHFRRGDEAFILEMRSRHAPGKNDLAAEVAALKKRHSATINSEMGTNLRGAFQAEASSSKSKIRKTSSSRNASKATKVEISNAYTTIHNSVESGTAARATSASYRLHPGKYVKCDPMLKEFFFPLLTSKLNFGFSSATGMRNVSWNDASANTIEKYSARGLYRGVAFFKLRYTSPANNRQDNNSLNDKPIKVAETGGVDSGSTSTGDVFSIYRRFVSTPEQVALSGTIPVKPTGGYVSQTTCQNFTEGVVPQGQYATDDTTIRQCGMGMNLAHLETNAYFSQNFRQNLGNLSTSPVGTSDVQGSANWNGYIPTPTSSNNETGCVVRGTPTDPFYYRNQKDAIMRIADGQLTMDITNTCRSNSRVEIVIHSMKKTENTINTPELYEAIYEAVDYAQKGIANANQTMGHSPSDPDVSNTPGGWQAFYDPDYPLLKTVSKHSKKPNDIATEVHRSIHVLAPGQTKNVKIALGSLYYSLGNKSTSPIDDADETISAKEDNVGTLAVCIGHTGFKALETMATTHSVLQPAYNSAPNNLNNVNYSPDVLGGGFWAGRSYAPSSILVGGNYVEKYYPIYFNSTQRMFGNFGVYTPSFFGGSRNTLPLTNIPQEVVATTPAHNAGTPVGTANKTLDV